MTAINSIVATTLLTYVEGKVYGEGFDPANPTNGLPYAMPNIAFDPSQVSKYISVNLQFNADGVHAKGGDMHQKQGLLQLTVYWPKDDGIIRPGVIADEIESDWPEGRKLYASNVKIIIGATHQIGPLEDETRNSIPVIIPWQVFNQS